MKQFDDTPYDELDPPVVGLCRAVNALPGLWTVSSCGGHDGGGLDDEGRSLPAGMNPAHIWMMHFIIDLSGLRPTRDAWLSLEFVAWVLTDLVQSHAVDFSAASLPPFLNQPGYGLVFAMIGSRLPRDEDEGIEPERVATVLADLTRDFYRRAARNA